MSGYTAGAFSVELYKGTWIQRAVLPSDLPAGQHPDAPAAIARWLAIGKRKHHSSNPDPEHRNG